MRNNATSNTTASYALSVKKNELVTHATNSPIHKLGCSRRRKHAPVFLRLRLVLLRLWACRDGSLGLLLLFLLPSSFFLLSPLTLCAVVEQES
jgi:hypothetical protein